MKVVVDADACPVKNIIVKAAKAYNVDVVMISDTSHIISDDYAKVITVDKGIDSADIYIANILQKDDVVITQDYGVAAMALGKGCAAINQNGLVYDNNNIDELLLARHIGKKIRRSGGKANGVKRRTKSDDKNFEEIFTSIIEKICHGSDEL